jgi:hypothetical protein
VEFFRHRRDANDYRFDAGINRIHDGHFNQPQINWTFCQTHLAYTLQRTPVRYSGAGLCIQWILDVAQVDQVWRFKRYSGYLHANRS